MKRIALSCQSIQAVEERRRYRDPDKDDQTSVLLDIVSAYLEDQGGMAIIFLRHLFHVREDEMKRVSVNVPDGMYNQLHDFASQHQMPLSLYARMLMVQAWKIGPEIAEVRKRVDELQACMHGFLDAIQDEEPEELTETGSRQPTKTKKYL